MSLKTRLAALERRNNPAAEYPHVVVINDPNETDAQALERCGIPLDTLRTTYFIRVEYVAPSQCGFH